MIVGSAGLMLGSLVVRDDCGPIESKFRRLVAMILLLSLSHCPSPGLVAAIVFTFKITQSCVRQSQSTVAHKVHTLQSPSGAIKISPIPSPLPGDSSTIQSASNDDGDAPLPLPDVPDPVPLLPLDRLVH